MIYPPFLQVVDAPQLRGAVAFSVDTSHVFREDQDICPLVVSDDIRIMPWGADNQMPFKVMDLIDADETLSTCANFNAEVAYGAGLRYKQLFNREELEAWYEKSVVTSAVNTSLRNPHSSLEGNSSLLTPVSSLLKPRTELDTFLEENNIDSLFFGQCADMKMFDFCVTVIFLSRQGKITHAVRKNAAYCRLSVADSSGRIPSVVYANWRNSVTAEDCEVIPLLDTDRPLSDLRARWAKNQRVRKYAILSRVPKVSSTYYPIPAYASIFRSDWYDIKRLIGKAKKAKLKNSAPIKYHIEVSSGYWQKAVDKAGITDPEEAKEYVKKLQEEMIDFLTGAENSGKVLFSSTLITPDGREIPEVKVTKISDEKEGGDYTTDIQEAVNMICFAMRVHSNLVGSVPGKSQSNNSGSDKRELYTIAQTLQKPYHSILLQPHRLICDFNGFNAVPKIDIIQLTTLDQHKDAQTSDL